MKTDSMTKNEFITKLTEWVIEEPDFNDRSDIRLLRVKDMDKLKRVLKREKREALAGLQLLANDDRVTASHIKSSLNVMNEHAINNPDKYKPCIEARGAVIQISKWALNRALSI